MLPGGRGGAGVQVGEEAGVQSEEQEFNSVEMEECWPGPVEREVSLIKWLLSTVQEK